MISKSFYCLVLVLLSGIAVNCSLSSSSANSGSSAGNFGGGGGNQNYGPNQYPYVPTAPQGFQTPFAPQPLLGPEQFNLALQQYLYALQQQYEALYRQQQDFINSWREAQANAYYGPNYGANYNPNQGYGGNYNPNQGFGANYNPAVGGNYNPAAGGGSSGGGSNSNAYATGAYTPAGIHQTAGIYPQNPANPNVDSRFGPDETNAPADGKPGYVGISTSSFSSSSDVDGKKTHKEGAFTTVNDNGKVTTYKVSS